MTTQTKGLLDPDVIKCPYAFYDELRKEQPISYRPELNGYFVASYEFVKLILTDGRFRKAASQNDGRKFIVPDKAAQAVLLEDADIGLPLHCLSESYGTRHRDFRKIVEPHIGPKGSKQKEAELQACADELLDKIGGAETCDLVSEFSMPYTINVMSDAIGFPRSMYQQVKDYAAAALTYLVYKVPEEEAVAGARTMVAMHKVVREMARERRANPKNDLLTALATGTVEGRPLTDREICYTIEELVTGGNDTTANAINGGLLYLAQTPDLQAKLRADPSQTPAFVEEAIRLFPPIQSAHRIAMEDVEFGGFTIKAGIKVYLGTSSANRDPGKFSCPEEFNMGRPDLNQHVAFGGGTHFCAGAHLTRVEQRVAYDEWLKRYSSIELAQPVESIEYISTFSSRTPVSIQLRMRRS